MSRQHAQALAAKQLAAWAAASPPCAVCGERLGKHRFGDDACPNKRWSAGNGKPQWLATAFSETPVPRPGARW